MRMAAEALPGMPSAMSGTREPPTQALFAASGTATPSMTPVPQRSGFLSQRLASL